MSKRITKFIKGAVAAVMVIVMVGCSSEAESVETQESTSDIAETGIEIHIEDISTNASYYDTTVDGTNVEIFAVLASDGTVRLAMNTCQVCNGSPYAYFVQEGDYFVCQNCGSKFSTDNIGVVSGGCNPVPITSDDYSEEESVITISSEFLSDNTYRFANWKNF
ncbi:MAG: DUF2318 domain-containing protein [Oscillospiraceae bacterium]|nr:DUF2318 domain-containing protein [Oscillospiraceae bacterium]